jgi:hypothetical protein
VKTIRMSYCKSEAKRLATQLMDEKEPVMLILREPAPKDIPPTNPTRIT